MADPGGAHVAFLIVLLVRPRGLFPRAVDRGRDHDRAHDHPMPFDRHPGVIQDRGIVALILIVVLVALPAFASRSLIQDMFFILTMLVLAQFWNLLAGYGGLVSIGQQAFVGIGAYAMFGVVILAGSRSDPGDPDWAGRGGPDCSPSRRRSSPSACRAPISRSAPGSSPRWCG
jgi:hypothetical protein